MRRMSHSRELPVVPAKLSVPIAVELIHRMSTANTVAGLTKTITFKQRESLAPPIKVPASVT
jgi:hypothetical protein